MVHSIKPGPDTEIAQTLTAHEASKHCKSVAALEQGYDFLKECYTTFSIIRHSYTFDIAIPTLNNTAI